MFADLSFGLEFFYLFDATEEISTVILLPLSPALCCEKK
jgi:hypothetical protein